MKSQRTPENPILWRGMLGMLLFCFFLTGACAEWNTVDNDPAPTETFRETYGIEIVGVRRAAHGYMLDFRYRVLDSAKAAALADRRDKPYLIDQESGVELVVPSPPKVGPLRQRSSVMKEGRVYYILFANPGKMVEAGSKVTVVVGDFRAEDLVVE